ncbi:MAG: zinc ribbon domain-containing protein [Acidobacteria bacterium]|nr:zinc ribbon domain-containing protein [Acidobacteriota bacterium]
MFCPHCGNEISSDRVRFCTHCRFPVISVKEFIATEAAKLEAQEEKKFYPLRQSDITLGASLMLIGVLAFMILATMSGDNLSHKVAIFEFLLGVAVSLLLLFSQLSPRQRGLTLGATLMFLGSLIAILPGIFAKVPGFLFGLVIVLPVILLWMRICRAFQIIFFDKDILHETSPYTPPQEMPRAIDPAGYVTGAVLTPVQNTQDVDLSARQAKKAEMIEPFSITEDTTEVLKNKQSR